MKTNRTPPKSSANGAAKQDGFLPHTAPTKERRKPQPASDPKTVTPAERAALKRLVWAHDVRTAAECLDAAAQLQVDVDAFLTMANLLKRLPGAWSAEAARRIERAERVAVSKPKPGEFWTLKIEATADRKQIIKGLRKIHYKRGSQVSDAAIAAFMASMAFTIPEAISGAINCFARYREAEGFDMDSEGALKQLTGMAV